MYRAMETFSTTEKFNSAPLRRGSLWRYPSSLRLNWSLNNYKAIRLSISFPLYRVCLCVCPVFSVFVKMKYNQRMQNGWVKCDIVRTQTGPQHPHKGWLLWSALQASCQKAGTGGPLRFMRWISNLQV